MKAIEEAIDQAVERLLAAARTIEDVSAERRGDDVVIEAARARLRRIADPRLRDLCGSGGEPWA